MAKKGMMMIYNSFTIGYRNSNLSIAEKNPSIITWFVFSFWTLIQI